jgi:hypothetical protein
MKPERADLPICPFVFCALLLALGASLARGGSWTVCWWSGRFPKGPRLGAGWRKANAVAAIRGTPFANAFFRFANGLMS